MCHSSGVMGSMARLVLAVTCEEDPVYLLTSLLSSCQLCGDHQSHAISLCLYSFSVSPPPQSLLSAFFLLTFSFSFSDTSHGSILLWHPFNSSCLQHLFFKGATILRRWYLGIKLMHLIQCIRVRGPTVTLWKMSWPGYTLLHSQLSGSSFPFIWKSQTRP